jgi:hypothetical protein
VIVKLLWGCETDENFNPLAARRDFKASVTTPLISFDAEGFIVCREHEMRRYGCRSVPYTSVGRTKTAKASWTPLEYEGFLLYNEIPDDVVIHINSTGEDRRDNRDPTEIGIPILASVRRRNGSGDLEHAELV